MTVLEIKIVIFIVVSLGLGWLSRRSLRDFRSHGLYRFFAWESVLVLVLMNINYWFDKPLSVFQIVSWLLLLISIILVIYGTHSLFKGGRPNRSRNDKLLIGIERTTTLVTGGAYHYIRHPMYSSFLFGAWGVFFKHFSLAGFCLAAATTTFAIVTAKREETENVRFFGQAYHSYMKRTKMFIPFLF